MKKLLMVLCCLLVLSGCATTHMTKLGKGPALLSAPDQATLVIIRETFYGKGSVFGTYLDGRLIGETLGQDYFITPVNPGSHYVVTAAENTGVAHLDFKAGQTYFLGQGVAMGVWYMRTSGFYPMSIEASKSAMKACSYMMYDPQKGGDDMDPQLYQHAINEYLNEVKSNPEGFKDMINYKGLLIN